MASPAVWAQREDVAPVLAVIRDVPLDDHENADRAGRHEIKLEQALLRGQSPREAELLNSNRRLESLGNLANSMRWFMSALLDLQQLADEDELDNPLSRVSEPGEAPRLPLTPAMSESFEALVHTYEQLIEMTLNTLHLEVRCRVLCNLSASLKRVS
jgi:exocyst complex component 4